jgi:hypothetical protein
MGNREYPLEARKEYANLELTLTDVIQSIEETVKKVEKIVFENDTSGHTKQ